jgi:hypothetical protein
MGEALLFARSLFGSGGLRGARQVIDISGDGTNNSGRPLDRVRDEVLADGITINGLPIHLERAASGGNTRSRQARLLETYYRDCVIGGPSAFVVSIEDESQIDAATRRKLLQEIIAAAPAVLRASAVDRDMSSSTCSGPEWPPSR